VRRVTRETRCPPIGAGIIALQCLLALGARLNDTDTNRQADAEQPKLPESAQRSIRRRHAAGEVSLADLAEEYSVGRSTIHRVIHRSPAGEA
jgi:Helix-turn-helix domain of resolvase